MGLASPGSRGHTQSGTLKPGICVSVFSSHRAKSPRTQPGRKEPEEALEKLLLPLAAAAAPFPSATGGNSAQDPAALPGHDPRGGEERKGKAPPPSFPELGHRQQLGV